MTKRLSKILQILLLGATLTTYAQWNNPHITKKTDNVLHGAFTSSPKTLDPARAYSSDEMQFIAQIYEPPLQYHYLKRPYQLEPLTLTKMPTVSYIRHDGKIIQSIYDLHIKPGIYYQPHPAFAKNNITKSIRTLSDIKNQDTRELTAYDYAYQIKRLASPTVHSPIAGVMAKHIVGFQAFQKVLQNAYQKQIKAGIKHPFLDLRKYHLSGVKVISKYHYQILINGTYPQFKYWLAMPFFAPMPWEADQFYANPTLKNQNISLDWYPVGTGPYVLIENNPNKQMVLAKNPNFRDETFPGTNEKLPFIDKFIFTLDKESIPRWNKFLQGYYDRSGISADSFDQAIKLDKNGHAILSNDMKKKGITLQQNINPSIFYLGFNMLDDVVGGYGPKKQKLRQAIAIAIDYEEFIQLFMNGRGLSAHGPIPPGIFGYETGKQHINDVVYFWKNGKATRKPLSVAKKLLAEAGYPNGVNPKTGKPLILHYDVTSSGSPDDKARFNWMRKQFKKLGIQLNIRHTEYNRFRDKVRTGQAQLFSWGWMADYPDPENFLFLLYSKNGKAKYGGENAANYANPKADKLFNIIKKLPNGPERLAKIRELLAILRQDSPWIWGMHPIDFTLTHQWVAPTKPHAIANNTLKYQKIDPNLRAKLRHQWNKPAYWPLWVLLGLIVLISIPLITTYHRRENRPAIKKEK